MKTTFMPSGKNVCLLLIPLLAFLATSCSDDESPVGENSKADFTSYSISGFDVKAQIDAENSTVYVQLPYSVTDLSSLRPEFTVSDGATVSINYEPQVSGASEMDFSNLVLYTVTSADKSTSRRWRVTVTNNSHTSRYGMGNCLTAEVSNDGSSPDGFYMQQQHTGANSDDNCGPACSAMALKWAYPDSRYSVEDARNETPYSEIDGGIWWYPRDVYNFLNNHGVQAYYWDFWDSTFDYYVKTIRERLDEGNLAISCLKMSNISQQTAASKEYRTHKYYPGSNGHFLLIKGYRVVNGVTWFEVHDPWGLDLKYSDGTPYGSNRYYLANEVATSINHNSWTVIVPPAL